MAHTGCEPLAIKCLIMQKALLALGTTASYEAAKCVTTLFCHLTDVTGSRRQMHMCSGLQDSMLHARFSAHGQLWRWLGKKNKSIVESRGVKSPCLKKLPLVLCCLWMCVQLVSTGSSREYCTYDAVPSGREPSASFSHQFLQNYISAYSLCTQI